MTSVATAGVPFGVTVRGVDVYGNNAYPYAGTSASLKSTDPKATLPGPYTYVQTDAAQHVFDGVILRTAGTQSVHRDRLEGPRRCRARRSTSLPASGAASYWPSAFAASPGA